MGERERKTEGGVETGREKGGGDRGRLPMQISVVLDSLRFADLEIPRGCVGGGGGENL
jgi:hypothetical protein